MSNYTDEEIKRIANSISVWRLYWELYKAMAPWFLAVIIAINIINMIVSIWRH